jgi:hypothetical protein
MLILDEPTATLAAFAESEVYDNHGPVSPGFFDLF